VAHRGSGTQVHWNLVQGLRVETPTVELTGDEAIRAARMILPKLNAGGGSRSTVRDAVQLLQEAGGPESCFAAASHDGGAASEWSSTMRNRRPRMRKGSPDALRNLPAPVRLALEMAAHEEIERRALESELAMLEDAWREAEEVAAIADDMFLPEGIHAFLEKHRRA
jgi:hypothetical protein